MSDPIELPESRDAEARKLADAIYKLAEAAHDLGSLPVAVSKMAASAARATDASPVARPSKPVPPTPLEKERGSTYPVPIDRPSRPTKPSEPAPTYGVLPTERRPLPPPPPTRPTEPTKDFKWEKLTRPASKDKPKKEAKSEKKPKTKEKAEDEKPEPSRARKVWDAFKDTGLGQRVTGSRAGRAASEVKEGFEGGKGIAKAAGLEGAGGAAGMAGKAIPVAGAAIAVAGVLVDFGKAVRSAAESALEAKRKYAELSGSQATILAESDANQMRRDMRHGEATAGSTKKLADSVNARREAEAPMNAAIEDLQNALLTKLNDLITNVIEPISEVVVQIRDKLVGAPPPPEVGGVAGLMPSIEKEFKRMEESGREAMERAKAAAARIAGGGVVRPGARP